MNPKDINTLFAPENILDSMADGVYVTNLEREIVYWNNAAERITGWRKQDVLGKSCMDEILCHVDKENRKLCGKDTCPLYRAITTRTAATVPMIVYAQSRSGKRLPMQVNVAPIYDRNNDIIGGVEIFRDMSSTVIDLAKAKEIQTKSFKWNMTDDCGLLASVHNIPHDMIGGDYYAMEQLSPHQFVFLLADVMGHGTSAALYTMYLRSLWEEYSDVFPDIAKFANAVNQQLYLLMSESLSFAAAVCGLIDLDRHKLELVGGSMPSPFLFNSDAEVTSIDVSGFALGMVEDAGYKTRLFDFHPGDVIFLYTDGAIEIRNQNDEFMKETGLLSLLRTIGYPKKNFLHQQIEEELIRNSNTIALNDDVTFLEFRFEG